MFDDNTPRMHIRMSKELKKRIDETAKQLGIGKSELVRQAVILYLQQIQIPKNREKETQ